MLRLVKVVTHPKAPLARNLHFHESRAWMLIARVRKEIITSILARIRSGSVVVKMEDLVHQSILFKTYLLLFSIGCSEVIVKGDYA